MPVAENSGLVELICMTFRVLPAKLSPGELNVLSFSFAGDYFDLSPSMPHAANCDLSWTTAVAFVLAMIDCVCGDLGIA